MHFLLLSLICCYCMNLIHSFSFFKLYHVCRIMLVTMHPFTCQFASLYAFNFVLNVFCLLTQRCVFVINVCILLSCFIVQMRAQLYTNIETVTLRCVHKPSHNQRLQPVIDIEYYITTNTFVNESRNYGSLFPSACLLFVS